MLVAHIVGTRPNFVKLAALYRRLPGAVFHTGQHTGAMSDPFFAEFELPKPLPLSDLSGDLAIVYGDCRATLEGAVAAKSRGMKIAHVEAGLRCGDLSMPEEMIRIFVDHMSDYLFASEQAAEENLWKEYASGDVYGKIYLVGNVVIDTLLPHRYGLLTLHRPFNVDNHAMLCQIVNEVARARIPFRWIAHPRYKPWNPEITWSNGFMVEIIPPLPRREFIELLRGSSVVVTDSGGVQEEAAWLGRPCLTLRPSTERPITLAYGNKLTNLASLTDDISAALPDISLWDGHAAERIAGILRNDLHF